MDFNVKIVLMAGVKDPAEIVAENPEKWQKFLEGAKTIHDFYFENCLAGFDKKNLEGKKKISRFLLPVIKRIPDKIEQNLWLKDLAEILEVREEEVWEELKKTALSRPEFAPLRQEEKANNILVNRSRKELLEERVAVLAIKRPEAINLLKERDLELFSPAAIEVINCLKENKESEQLNHLYLRTEIEEFSEPEKEFQDCLRELRFLFVRERLGDISREIKKEEKKNNLGRVQDLIRQFNQYSRQISGLEISEV